MICTRGRAGLLVQLCGSKNQEQRLILGGSQNRKGTMATYFRSDGWVKSALGAAVPGALIYVCAPQPANVAFLPPTPLAPIFADPNGLVPIAQPILTDGFGHYDFYVGPGLYTVVVVNAGKVQEVYPDQSVGNVGTGTSNTSGLIPGNNITIIGNVISAIGIPSGLALQTKGVPNVFQNLLNLSSSDLSVTVTDLGNGTVNLQVPVVAPPSISTLFQNIHGFSVSAGVGAGFTGTGITLISGSSVTTSAPTATDTAAYRPTSSGASYLTDNHDCASLGSLNQMWTRFALQRTTFTRNWIGFSPTTNTQANALASNLPSANLFGFRFSTSAVDTTWKCYASPDGISTTIVDTGITPDANFHLFSIVSKAGVLTFFMDNVLVATISTTLPAASTAMSPVLYTESLDGSPSYFSSTYMWWNGIQ